MSPQRAVPWWRATRARYRRQFRNTHGPGPYTPRIGMHTVFIARENILFLEEWILYHRALGVEQFFLYDNSAVTALQPREKHEGRQPGTIGNRGVPYGQIVTMTDQDIQDELDRLQREIPGVHVYPWSLKGEDGHVYYMQFECQTMAAIRHRDLVDWMLFMDIDEFLVLEGDRELPGLCRRMAVEGYIGAEFWEIQMDNRYNHLDKSVCEIQARGSDREHGYAMPSEGKILCYLPRVKGVRVHKFSPFHPRLRLMREHVHYRHYRCRDSETASMTVPPLSTPATTHGPEWKLDRVTPDWKQAMTEPSRQQRKAEL